MRYLLVYMAVVIFSACAADTSSIRPQQVQSGDVLWRLELSDSTHATVALPDGAAWVDEGPESRRCLRVSLPAGSTSSVISIPVDVTAWRGMLVWFGCQARIDDPLQSKKSWSGVQCILRYKTGTKDEWKGTKLFNGDKWRPLSAAIAIPEDASDGEVMIGLKDGTGTAWIADACVSVAKTRPHRLPPSADAEPPFRGHDLPRLRGVMSSSRFGEKEFADLEAMGVNAVRWQIGRNWGKAGDNRDLDEYDRWLDKKMQDLDAALGWAKLHGIRLLIDLHAPPGGREENGTMSMLLEEPYQEHFIRVWERFAQRYRGNPAVWGYDLINEPTQDRPSPPGLDDWVGIQARAARAIRAIDPGTAIVVEVDLWAKPMRFTWLEPIDVPGIIYSAHMYSPIEFTHQGVNNTWGEVGSAGRLEYPGTFKGQPLDRAYLAKVLQPMRDFQLAYNAHIIVGEFSAVRWAPGADRYLADCIDLFEEYGWDWCYHAFREWQGWSFEHEDLPYDKKNGIPANEPTLRGRVLMGWFSKNRRFP